MNYEYRNEACNSRINIIETKHPIPDVIIELEAVPIYECESIGIAKGRIVIAFVYNEEV